MQNEVPDRGEIKGKINKKEMPVYHITKQQISIENRYVNNEDFEIIENKK